MKSKLNKTIDFSLEEGRSYLDQAIKAKDLEGIQAADLKNSIINGDFFESIDHVEDKSVDLLIVDPPYNLRKDYHGKVFKQKKVGDYEDFTRAWIEKTLPKLKETASIYVCCDWKTSMIIGPILAEYFTIRNRITWMREKGRGAKGNWKNSMEDIWYASLSEDFTFNLEDVKIRRRVIAPYKEAGKPKDWEETSRGNFRNTHPSNLWDDITIPFWSMKENTAHPTQKPEKLIARIILASSRPHDLVLDPFSGSGTTCAVAKKLNRQFIGIEANPLYVAWSYKRLEMADYDPSIQGYEDGVFWERNAK
ncbi:MAG: DNA methyltransferase [Tissierellia bacterium]|nr:DNA methyltransferase [Tissierellia bacterium]